MKNIRMLANILCVRLFLPRKLDNSATGWDFNQDHAISAVLKTTPLHIRPILSAKTVHFVLGLERVTIYSNPDNLYLQKYRPETVYFADSLNISSWKQPPVGNLSRFWLYKKYEFNFENIM